MKTNFTFKHLDFSESLATYTDSQLEEISRFLLKSGACNVHYSKVKHDYCVEFSLNTKEKYFRAKAYAPDIYVAVDMAVDKLEKQVLKVRKINQHHKKFSLSKEGKMTVMNARFEEKPKWSRVKKAA